MRIPFISSFLLCLYLFTGAVFAQEGKTSRKTNFDEGWKFSLGHAGDPTRDFNFKIANLFSKTGKAEQTAIDPKFDDGKWRNLSLPHDWAIELPFRKSDNLDVIAHGFRPVGGLFPENSIGWYRKHFTVSKADSGQRFQIQFDGIFRDAEIWINGFYLGNNKSGYLGVTYDLTDYLNFGKDNVIVVRADASQYEGWFYEGAGIYRHVWLKKLNNLHIAGDGIFVHGKVIGKQADITVETTLENAGPAAAAVTVSSYVADRNGRRVSKIQLAKVDLRILGTGTVKQSLQLQQPRLWSLEDPYLYKIVSLVRSGNRIVDSVVTRYGVRTIVMDPAKGLFLNGKHVKIKGTNNHQDHAGLGSALPDYMQYYRINLLKELGSNAYRASHNAPTPELLDACDSLGMLVLNEQRLLNSSPEYLKQFERLIKRDRNHPSIFLWSIGNEEGLVQTTSVGKRIAQTLLAKQMELDPYRISTYAADLANVYEGINSVIPVRSFNYRQFAVADYHRDHPHQPLLGTEMGSTVTTRGIYQRDSIAGYVPDQDIEAPWWASRAEEWWKLAAENPYWMGGFIWTGFDYRGEPTPYKWPNVNSHFGVMDVCGFPKNIYYYYQSWWTDKDVLHLSPHWNWKGKEGQPIDVWVNTNADNVELFLNGKSLGKKDMPRNSHLQWSVPYQPGTLSAVAYKKGRKLTAEVQTASKAYEIVVSPARTTILADGKDAVVIDISAIDKEGRLVPDADNLVSFIVTGDMKIIGVGNGDPSSHEADKYLSGTWKRSLFNGKCQVILQAGKQPDKVKFEATAAGLVTGSTGIHTIQPGESRPVAPVKVARGPKKEIGQMLGADISFLPELEARGMKFSDKGQQKDAIAILKDHGFNYVRLRIFNNPAEKAGYSPGKGFCDLSHTLQMAKRVKAAGMKLLLDFHYSDYWADPEKQYKPEAWKDLPFALLKDSLRLYTTSVLDALKAQQTPPDMVQVGNEINHGIVWPEGHVGNLDSLAQLLQAGISGVKASLPETPIMLHLALGGQQDESMYFFDQMLSRGINFDVIGMSYYPKWHRTLENLRDNLVNMSRRYDQDIILVEYSEKKKDVHDIVFNLPGNKGKGTCIWEPLNTWEKVFNDKGEANDLMAVYDEVSKSFLSIKR